VTRAPLQCPADWSCLPLAALTTKIGSGATPTGGAAAYLRSRKNHAFIRSQNVYDRHFDTEGLAYISDDQADRLRNAAVQVGDVLLNITGDGVTFGRACMVPEALLPACVNQHVSIVRAKRDVVEPEWLLAYLTHPEIKRYIESFNSGGSRRAITKGHIESFLVPVPPVAEQRRLVRILGLLDRKIELNRRTNETLATIARSLFKSWFVDFDPVRFKTAGSGRVSADIACMFPSGFDESAQRECPIGWTIERLGQHIDLLTGFPFPSPKFSAGPAGVRLLRGANVAPGRVNWGDVAFWTDTLDPRSERCLLDVGDIVLAMDRPWIPAGLKLLMLAPHDVPSLLVQRVARLRGTRRLPRSLLWALLRDPSFTQHLLNVQTGTTIPHISGESIREYQFVLPPLQLADAFDRFAAPLMRQALENATENALLAEVRDLLLPRLLSGELHLREVERAIQEVA
jgi:type I restriction enzyme, S subunit